MRPWRVEVCLSRAWRSIRLAEYRLLVAARLFGVRLIDNLPLISGPSAPVEGGA